MKYNWTKHHEHQAGRIEAPSGPILGRGPYIWHPLLNTVIYRELLWDTKCSVGLHRDRENNSICFNLHYISSLFIYSMNGFMFFKQTEEEALVRLSLSW